MFLRELLLSNFKNYEQARFSFSKRVICLTGANGTGKTNLLDAIHYLALTKSNFSSTDSQSIRHSSDFFRVQGRFHHQTKNLDVVCRLKTGDKKEVSLNGDFYGRFAEHIGLIPIIMICPHDGNLITGYSDERRKFTDSSLSQLNREYLHNLIAYKRVLNQRNAVLKAIADGDKSQRSLLAHYNRKMAEFAEPIFEMRKAFVLSLIPHFQAQYAAISDSKESVSINYISSLGKESLLHSLEKNEERDLMLRRTTFGIHRDDLEFLIDEYPVRKFGSQGQQKSYLVALKLALGQYLNEQLGQPAILLIDDLYDKLDRQRGSNLLRLISESHDGQLFVTDTDPERLAKDFAMANVEFEIFEPGKENVPHEVI